MPDNHIEISEEMLANGSHYKDPYIKSAVPTGAAVDYSHMISIISTWRDILNARLLALLSLLGSMVGFGFCMYDPEPLRLWGLAIYAILCQLPILALYLRKG